LTTIRSVKNGKNVLDRAASTLKGSPMSYEWCPAPGKDANTYLIEIILE
jgi:hypothetical protein